MLSCEVCAGESVDLTGRGSAAGGPLWARHVRSSAGAPTPKLSVQEHEVRDRLTKSFCAC